MVKSSSKTPVSPATSSIGPKVLALKPGSEPSMIRLVAPSSEAASPPAYASVT